MAVSIPNDFPRFTVPGHEQEMNTLRELFWLHYPQSGPKATLWDIWLPMPSLWPAVETGGYKDTFRSQWNHVLSTRIIDKEGYVSIHQHPSIAHPLGWPFPFWHGGTGGYGWHFSFKDTVDPPWRPNDLSTREGWAITGATDQGIGEDGWDLRINSPGAILTAPEQPIDPFNAPFLQLRWKATGLGNAQPYVEWTTSEAQDFSVKRRFHFEPVEGSAINYTLLPVYKHREWNGEITQLRIGFGDAAPDASVNIQAFFTQYDSRHNTTSQLLVNGCAKYFWWTRDINFLRNNINRIRLALKYVMTEHQALERNYVFTTWVGHDGRSGIESGPDGQKIVHSGRGIGDNYWDLIPFGHKDAYATILYYDSLKIMATIEREIRAHPEWNVPLGVHAFDPDELLKHAAEVKATGNELFWNDETDRFVPNVDIEGKKHDFGFTFLNLEAIYYDFATPERAEKIVTWICGERLVEGDTSQGDDIYHWRFAPRTTTRRNLEYYGWGWQPEIFPWGGQVQDGGAVLGFSYHDLMARLKLRGPDDVWLRLKEINRWFREVQAAGDYRKYYNGSREGTCQGSGVAGGLGLDMEFFESVLVPQIVMDGFLGFKPSADGFALDPNLPADWPELTVDRIYFHDLMLTIRTDGDSIEVVNEGRAGEPCAIRLPKGEWSAVYIEKDGKASSRKPEVGTSDGEFLVDWSDTKGVRFERI